MNVIERTVNCLFGATVVLGFQGEAERTQVVIDASEWIEDFGDGGLLRVRHNPFNGDIYIPTGQTVENGVLTWTISASDTVAAGYGQGEVWYSVTDEDQVEHILASAVFTTRVIPSLATASSTIPTGLEDWLTEAEEVLEELGDVATQSELDDEVTRAKAAEAYLQQQIDAGGGGGGGGGAVSSVNGKTGAVVLSASDVSALPDDTAIPSKVSDLTNDSGFISEETDPTVPNWAKQSNKPSYTASEVGALPDDTFIPSKVSQLTNDSGFITDAGVTSVNGNTGAVTLSIPSKVSDLTNDAGYITSAPVSSVDGKTGTVTVLPSGGSAGQVLKKSSGTDYDVVWGNESGGGGGGTSDYSDLTNKPSINSVTLSGNKTASDLGLAAASDIPTVPIASTTTPSDLGTASAGSSTAWARGDHVHKMPTASDVGAYVKPSGGIPKTDLASAVQTSLGKADTALQSAPVTSVNGNTGAVTLTASDVGAGTYSKPSGGIPSTDLASAVQTSLGKADTALQSSAIANMQTTGNLVTSVSSSSTDAQYPSAKLFYDTVGNIESLLASI